MQQQGRHQTVSAICCLVGMAEAPGRLSNAAFVRQSKSMLVCQACVLLVDTFAKADVLLMQSGMVALCW